MTTRPDETADQAAARVAREAAEQATARELAKTLPPGATLEQTADTDEARLAARLAGPSGSPTMPWGAGPRPADWKDRAAEADDVLAELAAAPPLHEPETCGVQFVDKLRAYPERCQLPKGHPDSPGHRHGNIGWWRS